MKSIEVVKKNKLMLFVASAYLLLLLLASDKAILALKHSVYYLIEMVEILPIIFLLTVVIEALVPKEMIIKRFGKDSGMIGKILSLVLGSISAGPIYAAFPISKMLLAKGASISNVVIILSSWAVIKIPMLANEAKFLGADFMVVRWGLTVISIFVMGGLIERLIGKDIINIKKEREQLSIDQTYCIGCGICARMLPEQYVMDKKKAYVRKEVKTSIHDEELRVKIQSTVQKCPSKAIQYQIEE